MNGRTPQLAISLAHQTLTLSSRRCRSKTSKHSSKGKSMTRPQNTFGQRQSSTALVTTPLCQDRTQFSSPNSAADTAENCPEYCGRKCLPELPLLRRWHRDARALAVRLPGDSRCDGGRGTPTLHFGYQPESCSGVRAWNLVHVTPPLPPTTTTTTQTLRLNKNC